MIIYVHNTMNLICMFKHNDMIHYLCLYVYTNIYI